MVMTNKLWIESRYRIRRFSQHPERVWGIVLLIVLGVLVLIPVLYIIQHSFVFDPSAPRYVRDAQPGEWTTFYWVRVLFSRMAQAILYKPTVNSLAIAVGMTAMAMILGSLLAWLIVRTNLPWGGFFSSVLIVPYSVACAIQERAFWRDSGAVERPVWNKPPSMGWIRPLSNRHFPRYSLHSVHVYPPPRRFGQY
jgi:ABC-type sugar transport system permease subunit